MAAARAEQLKKEVVEYKWNIMQDGVIGSDGFRQLEDYSKWCVERNRNNNLTEIDYQKELTNGLYQNTSESLVAIGEAMSGSRISYQKVKELVIKIKGSVEQYGATKISVAAGNFMEYCDRKSSDGCKIYHNRLKELNEEFSWKMAEYFGKKEQADEARKNVMPVWDLNLDPPP